MGRCASRGRVCIVTTPRNEEQEEAIRADIATMRCPLVSWDGRRAALARLRAAGFRDAIVKFYPADKYLSKFPHGDAVAVMTQGRTLPEAIEQAHACCTLSGLKIPAEARATAAWLK